MSSVSRESDQGEAESIARVLKVEDTSVACAHHWDVEEAISQSGKLRDQEGDCLVDFILHIIDVDHINEGEKGPSGLADCWDTAAVKLVRVIVWLCSFSKTTIGVLSLGQPFYWFADPLLLHIIADSLKAWDNTSHGVDKVDSPTSLPWTIGSLRVLKVLDRALDNWILDADSIGGETFHDMGGNIRGTGIKDLSAIRNTN